MKRLIKQRILIVIFFLIATTVGALHELKHIENHDSSSCQICIVDEHSVSGDIVVRTVADISFSFCPSVLQTQISNPHAKKTTNHSNAPPHIS